MNDLISRQAAIDILDAFRVKVENGEDFAYSWARMRMTELPSVQERKGRWIIAETEPEFIACSACIDKSRATGGKIQIWRKAVRSQLNYCPRCGAEMEGAEDAK